MTSPTPEVLLHGLGLPNGSEHNEAGLDIGASAGAWGPAHAHAAAVVILCVGVLLLSPVILCGNALLLHALHRFKRLRTPSNYLLASLASSDLGVGVVLPLCAYLEVRGGPSVATTPAVAVLCALPHCLLTALCCASLLVMAAIAVDRFTSLAQPLRYNNLITHRSVERYIAGLWLYAGLAAATPLVARLWPTGPDPPSAPCSGLALLRPPGVAVLLVCAVYAPCALLVVGCYSYVYLVARTHHRAIYSVEISLRHAHDAPFASRYTSTLAITVGLFVGLWMPFQVTMLVDLACGLPPAATVRTLSLSLPMFASSALNPWVYGYRNGEMRAAVQRVLDETLTKMGLSSPHLGCPHLMTTGVDAELNSFASNARLCAVSTCGHPGNGSHTHHTLLHLPSAASASPSVSNVEADADDCTVPGTRLALPSTPRYEAKLSTPSSTSLMVPGTSGTPAVSSIIALAQTVVELREPANDRPRQASAKRVHHV